MPTVSGARLRFFLNLTAPGNAQPALTGSGNIKGPSMPKIRYIDAGILAKTKSRIDQANEIVAEYAAQGFDLTLRQLYYQFVARALIPNTQRDYKNLGSVINDARLAGLIDWETIVDRTRE